MDRLPASSLLHPAFHQRLASLATLLLAASLFAPLAQSQIQAPRPSPRPFDVAAIKPDKTGSNSASMSTSHGRLTATNVTARTLILRAFQLKDIQISGGPGWIDTDRYDVSARTEDRSISDDDLWLSLQPLLLERFHLKFRRGIKQGPVLSLVTDKAKAGLVAHRGTDTPSLKISSSGGKASLVASNISMAKLASSLSGFTGRIVVDNTRLNGGFDFKLEWEQDRQEESRLTGMEESLGITGPSIYTALPEQLGLKLQHANGPVENLVVDSIDRPTEN